MSTKPIYVTLLLAVSAVSMFLFIGGAQAMTYDISASGILGSSLTGTVTLDASGKITGEKLVVSEPFFSGASRTISNAQSTVSLPNPGSGWVQVFTQPGYFLALVLNYQGSSWSNSSSITINSGFSYYISSGLPLPDYFSGRLTAEVAATPLPAALPLFAGGLGALSLLGWRRKRKAAALFA
jgi:hypothetical protein